MVQNNMINKFLNWLLNREKPNEKYRQHLVERIRLLRKALDAERTMVTVAKDMVQTAQCSNGDVVAAEEFLIKQTKRCEQTRVELASVIEIYTELFACTPSN